MALCLENLPSEVLNRIWACLDTRSRLNCGLTSQSWLGQTLAAFGQVTDLVVSFVDDQCEMELHVTPKDPESGTYALNVGICQCQQHVTRHIYYFSLLLEKIGSFIRRLVFEDNLVGYSRYVAEISIECLLSYCPGLTSLELDCVSLQTMGDQLRARLARLRALGLVRFQNCCSNGLLSPVDDRLALALCQSPALCQLALTRSNGITDGALRLLANQCPLLSEADFSGCQNVTAKGVTYFLRSLPTRVSQYLYLTISGTGVDCMELDYFLFKPINSSMNTGSAPGTAYSSPWKYTFVELAIAPRACCIQNILYPTNCCIIIV